MNSAAILAVWIAATATAGTGAPRMTTTTTAPVHARPADAVTAYFEGRDQGSSKILRTTFHPETPLQWVGEGGTPKRLEQGAWWDRLEKGVTPATRNEQKEIDREGGMALMEATSSWPTHEFRDLLLLAESPAGWLIVGKAFTRIPAGESLSASTADDEKAIRAVTQVKIDAHTGYDPSLLVASHLPDCRYFRVNYLGAFANASLSEGCAHYAARRERGEHGRDTKWTVGPVIQRGDIAAVKLAAIFEGKRLIDYLLYLRTADGWKIAAVVYGDPLPTPATPAK
jgi:hypothetical protein